MEEQSKKGKNFVVIFFIVLGVLLLAAGIWYFAFYKPEQEAKERARLAQIQKEEEEQKKQEELANRKVKFDQLILKADSTFNEKDWTLAQSLYSEAHSLFPNDQHTNDQLALVNARLEEIAAWELKKAAGIVEEILNRTGRSYIVVSSSIDKDLAMDFATKLAKEGNSINIIQDIVDGILYHRVCINSFASIKEAEYAKVDYASYGEGVWAMQY